jgi:CheY-like chemotaxis protein
MEIERRRMPILDLRALLDRSFAPLAQQKGIDFAITVSPDVPPTLTTDGQRLEQILKNLLSNAFKFTEAGRVVLDVAMRTGDHGFQTQALKRAPATLAFAVSDTGIGIPADKQEVIFEAFQQADPSTSRTYGGTGLGLTISRELARLLGGEIHLRSSLGTGSTFTLFLPLGADERGTIAPAALHPLDPAVPLPLGRLPAGARPSAPPRPLAPRNGLRGARVMVVDDDVRNLFALISLLERHQVEVVPASSGREAIDLLRHRDDIDLVLMDIMMPEMDGYEATRAIRKLEGRERLPVIALTAKAMPGDREKCLEAGCNDFVSKPVESEQLITTLRQWIAAARRRP